MSSHKTQQPLIQKKSKAWQCSKQSLLATIGYGRLKKRKTDGSWVDIWSRKGWLVRSIDRPQGYDCNFCSLAAVYIANCSRFFRILSLSRLFSPFYSFSFLHPKSFLHISHYYRTSYPFRLVRLVHWLSLTVCVISTAILIVYKVSFCGLKNKFMTIMHE